MKINKLTELCERSENQSCYEKFFLDQKNEVNSIILYAGLIVKWGSSLNFANLLCITVHWKFCKMSLFFIYILRNKHNHTQWHLNSEVSIRNTVFTENDDSGTIYCLLTGFVIAKKTMVCNLYFNVFWTSLCSSCNLRIASHEIMTLINSIN